MGDAGLFETYEQDFNQLLTSINGKLSQVLPTQTGESRKKTLTQLERDLADAEEVLGQMDTELHSLSAAVRARFQPRVRTYRSDLDKLKQDYKRVAKTAIQADERDALLRGGAVDGDENYDDPNARLLQGTNRLNDASRRLEESHRVALETETIGAGILGDLRRQREQLQRAGEGLRTADSNIDRSSRLLKGMAQRLVTNRFLQIGVILVLLFILGILLYSKFA